MKSFAEMINSHANIELNERTKNQLYNMRGFSHEEESKYYDT